MKSYMLLYRRGFCVLVEIVVCARVKCRRDIQLSVSNILSFCYLLLITL